MAEPCRIEPAAGPLDQLKSLLFQGESHRLAEVEQIVERLDQRIGDAHGLEQATAEIIVEALRDAEVARHRELADAIAPVVVAAIRSEIRNSREMMVEALYPLTGQMVVAAVQNAFRELVASLNQRLDALTSTDRLKLQVRSKLSGRPISELALEQTRGGRITRIFVVENGSGRIIESWRADEQEDEHADMVGGLIAAITGFARDALDAGANELRTLDFGGRKTFLRNSPQTIVAAETTGDLTRDQVYALDNAFLTLIDAYGRSGTLNDDELRAFAAEVDQAATPVKRKSSTVPLKIATAIVLLLASAYGWRAATRWWQERQINTAVAGVVAQRPQLAAFPFKILTDHSAETVELNGVLPSAADAGALADALKTPAGQYKVVQSIAIVAPQSTVDALTQRNALLENQLARLDAQSSASRDSLDALSRGSASTAQVMEMQARLDAMASSGASTNQVEELRKRMEAVAVAGAPASIVADLRTRIEALSSVNAETRRLNDELSRVAGEVAKVSAKLNAPDERLRDLVGGFAIFFAERDRIVDEAQVAARLDAVAALLTGGATGVRVVGHTDTSGGPAQNQAIAKKRADVVADMLLARNVDRNKISIISRAASFPIAEQEPATRARNRRVTLEAFYENEDAR